ncbi:metal ABC transporter permease [Thiospirillum jenense]|uniref:Metal ABC transporter permease n=2 Tax=Thiospirillum jenense TaxID=1653858 RepID=A0A839HPW6_9GAMM|nr:metal ABC transporter permease [Thiospirillum jenense]
MFNALLAPFNDPLFHLPLVTGLLLAGVLPVIGTVLMLRDEWLAALGLAHLAAAGALLGHAVGLPGLIGATLGALGGGVYKTAAQARGNVAYGMMILCGWSATLLIAANSALGEQLAHALAEGQLYFAGAGELTATLLLLIVVFWTLPHLMPHLLRSRFFPRCEHANALPAWQWHFGFDLLAAASLAVATVTLGLMSAFALALIPAWIAFQHAPSWRWTLIGAAGGGVLSYLIAFATALHFDQPFGPVLVAVLIAAALLFKFHRD